MAKVYTLKTVQQARQKAGKPEPDARQWVCERCKADTGVATSDIMQITTAPRIKGLKVVGGTKRKVCAHCWRRGITTAVI